jgi:hypothetical protein
LMPAVIETGGRGCRRRDTVLLLASGRIHGPVHRLRRPGKPV